MRYRGDVGRPAAELHSAVIDPRPMLTSQVSYFDNMVSRADQAPGGEANKRFDALTAEPAELLALYEPGD